MEIPYWYPTDELPNGYNTEQPKRSHGITHVHQFYTKRCLAYLSCMYNKIIHSRLPLLRIWFTSQLVNISKLNRYRPQVSFPYNPLSGTCLLYTSAEIPEWHSKMCIRDRCSSQQQQVRAGCSQEVAKLVSGYFP